MMDTSTLKCCKPMMFKQESTKERLSKVCIRRVKQVIRLKFGGEINYVRALNSWAVSLLSYDGGVVNCAKLRLS